MSKQRTTGVFSGRHSEPDEPDTEINSEMGIVSDTDTNRVSVKFGDDEPQTIEHPRVSSFVAYVQRKMLAKEAAEAYAKRQVTPIPKEGTKAKKGKTSKKQKSSSLVCDVCLGFGEIHREPCSYCNGTGWTKIE